MRGRVNVNVGKKYEKVETLSRKNIELKSSNLETASLFLQLCFLRWLFPHVAKVDYSTWPLLNMFGALPINILARPSVCWINVNKDIFYELV